MAKRKHKNEGTETILFRCLSCKSEEFIPKDVVDFFDIMDGGDPAFPPRFDCHACTFGKMQPVHYVGHDGIVYKL
jgi:hypothetical protein